MDKQIIALFPGAFKPPTRSHFKIVEKVAKICNEVQVIISSQSREGYGSYISEKVWRQYKKLLPENVVIKVSSSPSPITEIYQIVKDKSKDYIVVYGKGEQKRYKHINENRQKYENVDVFDVGNIEEVSATRLRKAINERNLKEIKKLIPEGIKVKDFLLNFQLHEIKVNKPLDINSKIKEIENNIIYNDEYIKLANIQIKYGRIHGESQDDFLNRLSNKKNLYYKDLLKLNEIKINKPSIFPQELLPVKDKIDHYVKYEQPSSPEIKAANIFPYILRLNKNGDINISELSIENFKPGYAGNLIKRLATYIKNHHLDEDKIPGGLAKGKSLQDIAKHHKERLSTMLLQLTKGIEVEMEHTTSKKVAKEIAMDHLWEDPKYYDKLASIEEITIKKPTQKPIVYIDGQVPFILDSDGNRYYGNRIEGNKFYFDKIGNRERFHEVIKYFKGRGIMKDNFSLFVNESDVIIKNILDEIKINVIDESKNLGNLYHFTDLESLDKILESNLFLPSTTPTYDHQRDFQSLSKEKRKKLQDKGETSLYYFSLSRDKLFYKKHTKIGKVPISRIQVNGNKLSTKYKFTPFNYYSDEIDSEQERYNSNEGEERIILPNGKGIPNINNYITKIDILLDKIEDVETYLKQAEELIKKYPNINLLYKEKPTTMEEYKKTVLPTIEYYRDEEFLEVIDKTLNEVFQPLNENIEVNSELYIELLNKCFEECCQELNISKPELEIINDDLYTKEHNSYGGYSPTENKIYLVIYGRDCMSSVRSLSHEIYHHFDNINGKLTQEAGKDGDVFENSANSYSGKTCRWFGRKYPEAFFLRYD